MVQARRLAASARMLPVDDAAKVLEQAVTVLPAQTQVLVDGERPAALAAASGCRTVRSFASSILRRSTGDASGLASVAVHLGAFPRLTDADAAGTGAHPEPAHHHPATCPPAGSACCKTTRMRWPSWPPVPGRAEVGVFCQALGRGAPPRG